MPAQVRFGARDLVYALLTESSDVVGGTPAYGTPVALANLAKISVNPNGNSSILFADDGPRFVADTIGKVDVTFDLADITTAAYAAVLGHTIVNGVIAEKITDQSPYIAVGFKITRTGGTYDYMWLLKGKLTKPDISAETKKESINFQMQTLKGQFVALTANDNWRTRIRTDDAAVPAATITGFFTSVVVSSAADLGAFTLTSGAAVSSTKTLTLTFAKAGGGTTQVNGASAANVITSLVSSGAILTPVSFTPGAASATPTLVVVYSAMTAAAHITTVTAGVTDSNGVPLVLKSVIFTAS